MSHIIQQFYSDRLASSRMTYHWHKESGMRIEGSRGLDSAKVQAPGVVRIPNGGFRLFYTAVGPGKPFAACQGYILSAISDDGLSFSPVIQIQGSILHGPITFRTEYL